MHHCENYVHRAPPGDIAEFGVRGGESLVELAISRRCWTCYGFDCWTGLPRITDEDGTAMHVGQFACPKACVEEKLRQLNLTNVVLIEGLVEDTLPGMAVKLAFCFLDLDLYSSTRFVCEWLEDHLVPSAIVGFHDYDFQETPGITKVVDALPSHWVRIGHGGISVFYRWHGPLL